MVNRRAQVIGAVVDELSDQAGMCFEAFWTTGSAVADRLGLEPPPLISRQHGLWVDDPATRALTDAYLEELFALRLDHVALMVERSGRGFDPTWSLKQLRAFSDKTSDRLRCALTFWPEPTRQWMQAFAKALPGMAEAARAWVIELDLEGFWKKARLDGFASMRTAGRQLMEIIEQVSDRLGRYLEVEVTTFPAHVEATARGAVLGEDRLLLQTYTISEARGEKRAYAGRYGPERRPAEDLELTRRRGEQGVELAAGLAAWKQDDWPGEPFVAMRKAYQSAVRGGAEMLRWWSSKHILGVRKNRYAYEAVQTIIEEYFDEVRRVS